MALAIVGSRTFTNYEFLKLKVLEFMEGKNITTIISGGASGADNLAEKFAKEYNLELLVFPANWRKYGNRAGPVRNSQIVDAANYLIAFPSKTGRGTQNSISKAKKKGIPVIEHYID